MSTKTASQSRYSHHATHNGIGLRLIGEWLDLAAYYTGTDGNAWAFNVATGRFSNCGEIGFFRANFANHWRGELFAE